MDFKLNVYDNNGNIEKVHCVHDFKLRTGTAEEILKLVNIDKIAIPTNNSNNSNDVSNDLNQNLELLRTIMNVCRNIQPLIMEIFPELTEDEYKRTNLTEVGSVVLDVINYTLTQLFNATDKKN